LPRPQPRYPPIFSTLKSRYVCEKHRSLHRGRCGARLDHAERGPPNPRRCRLQPFSNSPAYARVAAEAGIQVVGIDEVRAKGAAHLVATALKRLSEVADRIYIDLDIDVLDRCFAPAAPGSRPGGMQPRDILEAARICGAHPKVAAIDVVEIDPNRDVADATVLAAAGSVLSFAAGYRTRSAA